jgi:hypothetical protein
MTEPDRCQAVRHRKLAADVGTGSARPVPFPVGAA